KELRKAVISVFRGSLISKNCQRWDYTGFQGKIQISHFLLFENFSKFGIIVLLKGVAGRNL
ncbi:hypothetical protein RK028_04915, partial [Streptococcus pneumoniae]|nr:hypothetical protein [Streptococcus pneumoniae]